MATPESPMPGAFVYDNPIPPKLDLGGASSGVFQPPSPMSAASSLCRTIRSNQGSSRKRQKFQRSDDPALNASPRNNMTGGGGYYTKSTRGNPFEHRDLASPAPFINTDYRFAGGLDEPSASLVAAQENEEYNGQELDYRPNRYRGFTGNESENYPMETTASRGGNSRKRARPSSSSSSSPQKGGGWGQAVFNMVGGVAGKVWDFCWSGAFRGFHAGGGVGYQMKTPQRQVDQDPWQTDSGRDRDLFRSHSRDGVPIPGRFPSRVEDEYPDRDGDELNQNWIIVHEELDSGQSSPSQGPRKLARRSSGVARPITPRRAATTRTARKSMMPPGRPSSSSYTGSYVNAYASSPKNPQPSPKRGTGEQHPASAEAQRYAAKVRRREREEDASIQRLNQQLKAMIKEGKEALGTKVEVDDSMDLEFSD